MTPTTRATGRKKNFRAAGILPVARWRKVLLGDGVLDRTLDEIEARVADELKAAIEFAEKSPLPDPAEACTDIFTPFCPGGVTWL